MGERENIALELLLTMRYMLNSLPAFPMSYSLLHILGAPDSTAGRNMASFFDETLYNLNKLAGSNTFSLEIVGAGQFASFFAAVPQALSDRMQSTLYAALPDSEIIPSKDYAARDFTDKGAIVGADIDLAYSHIYSFKQYTDLQKDSLSDLCALIAKMKTGEEVWVQLIIRPYSTTALANITQRITHMKAKVGDAFRTDEWFGTTSKAPGRAQNKKEKGGKRLYDARLRIGYRAADRETAARRLTDVMATLKIFNDVNKLIPGKITEGNNFLRRYRERHLSHPYRLSTTEIATLYHIPSPAEVPHTLHLVSRRGESPADLPLLSERDVSPFGITNYHQSNQPFGIRRADRRRHLYAVGKSGSGKSKWLELLIENDIKTGKGVAVIDPHGDLVDNILRVIPKERMKDVIYFDPADIEFPIAFNPLENVGEAYKMQVTVGIITIFKRLFGAGWNDRLEHVLRYTLLALLDSPNTTVLSIVKMLTDKKYRQSIVARIQDSVVKNFWVSEFAAYNERYSSEAINPLINKVGQLVATNMVRNIIGQPDMKFNIRQVMDSEKILLLKVSKGLLGVENASLLGSIFITKMYQAAMQRADMREEDRKDFYCYIDEFQNFATDTFAEILSEARKYRLNLTLTHQYLGQLPESITKTVFGNVGSLMSFRVGAEDAAVLAQEFHPKFTERDIVNLGVRDFYIKMSINGEIREAFSGKTMDVSPPPDDYTQQIIAMSREQFCRPRMEVESILSAWNESSAGEEQEVAEPKKRGEAAVVEAVEDEGFEEPLL